MYFELFHLCCNKCITILNINFCPFQAKLYFDCYSVFFIIDCDYFKVSK